jgi:hypothetical protein
MAVCTPEFPACGVSFGLFCAAIPIQQNRQNIAVSEQQFSVRQNSLQQKPFLN